MKDPSESDDVWKQIHGIMTRKYGDYVLHILKCHTTDEALGFQRRLSFVTGSSLSEMIFPANIQPVVVQMSDYVLDVIGGQLTSDQNVEVRRLAAERAIECESMCVAKTGTLTQREFLKAGTQLKNEQAAGKKKH
jgi:hypothetical protein